MAARGLATLFSVTWQVLRGDARAAKRPACCQCGGRHTAHIKLVCCPRHRVQHARGTRPGSDERPPRLADQAASDQRPTANRQPPTVKWSSAGASIYDAASMIHLRPSVMLLVSPLGLEPRTWRLWSFAEYSAKKRKRFCSRKSA